MNNGQLLLLTTILTLLVAGALFPKYVPGHGLVPMIASPWLTNDK
jgi:hypothetical protein